MVDDDDVSDWAMFGNDGNGGCVGAIFFLAILLALVYFASQNNDECAKRSCPEGSRPKVTSHECLCVTPAR